MKKRQARLILYLCNGPGDNRGLVPYELYCLLGSPDMSQFDIVKDLYPRRLTYSNTERRDMVRAANWLHSFVGETSSHSTYQSSDVHAMLALYMAEWDEVHWREVSGWNRRGVEK